MYISHSPRRLPYCAYNNCEIITQPSSAECTQLPAPCSIGSSARPQYEPTRGYFSSRQYNFWRVIFSKALTRGGRGCGFSFALFMCESLT